jgi:uncharacterized NAD-dependent epimerase/dehydratase family protein
MVKSNAIVITGGYLDTGNAKTAHGLIRGTDRFNIVGVIDQKHPGRDAGEVLDGMKRDIPVYSSIADFKKQSQSAASYCIVGVATKGGVIPPSLHELLYDALQNNFNLVNGLHEHVSDIEDLAALAKEKGLEIIDVRKPKKFKDLHFWSGKISTVKCPKIAVLGTDCALGKRTTTRFLVEGMRKAGYKAEMIYTGQTGWMQGAKYGFVFDSTLNDFISGEMEHAIVSCYREEKPDIIFIEGQSSLRNPSGPAGAEWIVSAEANAVVLQHDPARIHYKDMEFYPALVAKPEEEIELISIYGAPTVALALNTGKVGSSEGKIIATEFEKILGIPVVMPLEEGIDRLIPIFEKMINESIVEAK